uniref:Putative mucin-2 n=1 Tax=Rhipicephalus pulchellus TaxID=72859 RepID=L7LX25_RHIPC
MAFLLPFAPFTLTSPPTPFVCYTLLYKTAMLYPLPPPFPPPHPHITAPRSRFPFPPCYASPSPLTLTSFSHPLLSIPEKTVLCFTFSPSTSPPRHSSTSLPFPTSQLQYFIQGYAMPYSFHSSFPSSSPSPHSSSHSIPFPTTLLYCTIQGYAMLSLAIFFFLVSFSMSLRSLILTLTSVFLTLTSLFSCPSKLYYTRLCHAFPPPLLLSFLLRTLAALYYA